MSSSGCRYSSAISASLFLVCYQCWLVRWASCFTNRQWKGQPSFSRQRMSLPPPHARQCPQEFTQQQQKMSVHGEHDDKVVLGGFLATSTRFRGIGGQQLPRTNHKSRVSMNSHSLALVCDRETDISENLNHKKAAPPLPDRILVASYVSAGRWSQTSLCYFHPQSFVLLLWIACLSDWLCAKLFHTQQKTPTLHKSEVAHTQPEFCERKKKVPVFA